MSAHTRKLEERRARALARRAELGAENRAPAMEAPWALGESEAPAKRQPAAAPVATDAPPRGPRKSPAHPGQPTKTHPSRAHLNDE